MSKSKAILYVIVITLIYNVYTYVNNRVIDPFMIDASKSITENPTSDLLNTIQGYYFGLVNTSDKPVNLINIELEGYQGIKIGELTVAGNPLLAQKVKSNREYSSSKSWSTNSQGLVVEYQVEILEPKIKNPTSALITYSYLGIKHKQVIGLSEVKRPGITMSNPPFMNLNFHVSIISTLIALILLIIIYRIREINETYLGIKLFGYSYLGAFNLNIIILIPLGIIIYLLLFRPKTNATVKMYSALCGFTFMIISYLFTLI
ncbi:hypothetical protein QFZ77_003002 [Paenibacillus sp. V4I3]|uniref:hypothetical protein n=1 Tax=Paenibacillus sp. V4I3 TaxID=3042305 RepID=UPI002781FCBC|nr:hypothetical protein [Paenibacillus sp. V4I3]MDQ0874343.1 hypothetical protein [Paenibacillus sp. V4I3]